MVQHTNFYESIAEAKMRLDETVVLYDGLPYHFLCCTDHRQDGIFRAYIDPVSDTGNPTHRRVSLPYCGSNHEQVGKAMDLWLETSEGKSSGILRKMMNSPKFNKFRPFDVGMLNCGGRARYVERAPTRHTQQGITSSSLVACEFDLLASKRSSGHGVNPYTPGLYSAILALHPDIDTTLTQMTDEEVSNTSTAFHRQFAVVRGPMDILFLAYKGEIVGFLPYNNTTEVKIGPKFSYVKEVVDELACFTKIS